MATGEAFRSLAFQFRIHHSYISRIVHPTLAAIVSNLTHIAMPQPTEEQWKKNAADFEAKWSYPNCIGAIDGKHVRVRCPNNTGSQTRNYKEFFSIVLLAIVDANYNFVAVDIGAFGREGDAGVFMRSNFGKRINNNTFNIPPPKPLPGTNIELPHVIVGDEAFALHENLMKSYPRQAANDQRRSQQIDLQFSPFACRVGERIWNFMRVFPHIFTSIQSSLGHFNNIIMGSCILYNLLRDQRTTFSVDAVEMQRRNLIALAPHTRRYTDNRYDIRDAFKDYFNGVGATDWQDAHIDFNF